MARSLYIEEDKSTSSWLRRLLIILLTLALAAGLIVGGLIWRNEQRFDQFIRAYQQALDDQDYEAAVTLYRQAQESALSPAPLERNQQRYQDIMAEIELLTQKRIGHIEEQILAGEKLSPADQEFVQSMAEVTAVHLVQTMREMASRYLSGEISLAVLKQAFNQLASLDNIEPAIGDLPGQFNQMTAAVPVISQADQALEQEDYWKAHALYKTVLADDELAGFVHEQTQLRLEICEDMMLQPLLDQAHRLMEGGRYLSAERELLLLAGVFPANTQIEAALQESRLLIPGELVPYNGIVEFISIRPLIVDPERAFDGDAYAATANDAMITVAEFKEILKQMHINDFILIDSDSIYNADRTRKVLQLPEGKKPFVLVIDGLNYYASRRETGNAWDLVIDQDGNVSGTYPDARGNLIVDREGEMIGILDLFVQENPDFSLDGAKGTISLTGYECIFGKVTDINQLDERNRALQSNGRAPLDLSSADIAKNHADAKAIIEQLMDTGWRFASSTYGYINASEHGMERIVDDTEKWLQYVGSLTGPVTMMNYPNGAFISGSDERSGYLREQGFILFGGLGTQPYFYIGDDYYYVDKTPINGFTLRNSGHYQLDRLFDSDTVFDQENRPG